MSGTSDRPAWAEELERRVTAAYRGRYPLVVALLDLDRFATGELDRAAGERLLTETAEAWRTHVRPEDVLVRCGDEGFGIILSRVQLPAAERIVTRLQQATPGGETLSAGLALWNGSEDAHHLTARAAEALDAAKRAGRNRYVIEGAASVAT